MTDDKKTVFEWKPEMSVGDEIIDEQHRQLLKHINDLLQAVREGWGEKIIGETMVFLEGYIIGHFEYEEYYMQHHGYPDLEHHRRLHREFTDRYRKFKLKLYDQNVSTASLAEEINDYIGRWWVEHIGCEDKKYYEYIKNKSQNGQRNTGTSSSGI